MSTISPEARRELVATAAERYRQSTAVERGRILDEFVALTGYHRKHVIQVLNGAPAMPPARRGRRSVYDEAVTEGLVVLWEASDRVCGKRLKALLPTLVPALERHGHLTLDPRVREQADGGERRHDRPPPGCGEGCDGRSAPGADVPGTTACGAGFRCARSAIGRDPAPGSVEADLVAHCGSSMAGKLRLDAGADRYRQRLGRNAYRCSCVKQVRWSTRWIGFAARCRFRCRGSTPTTAASSSTRC